MKFNSFKEHVIEHGCAVDLADHHDYDFVENYGLSLPYVLTRKMVWDGKSPHMNPLFNTEEDGVWKLMIFNCRQVSFYLQFIFSASRQAFILFILLGDTVAEASRYKARIWLEEVDKEDPVRTEFMQNIVSIEEQVDIEDNLDNSKYVIIPYAEMEPYFCITKNPYSNEYPDEIGKYTLAIPVQIEDIVTEN